MFADSQSADKEIILLDVTGNTSQRIRVHFGPVDVTLTENLESTSVAECQAV